MVNRLLAVAVLWLILAGAASAQSTVPSLVVESNPPGAQADLEGPMTFSALTPATFIQPLYGQFELKVYKDGYETHSSSVFLEPGSTASVTVDLKAKTRFKAALRSLLIPGWGQFYTDQKSKGFLFLGLLTIAGTAAYATHDEFKYREDVYEDNLRAYNNASSFEEKEALYPALQTSRRDLYDAETARLVSFYAIIGVWGLNVIDALVFFPDYGHSVVDGLSVSPNDNFDGATVSYTITF